MKHLTVQDLVNALRQIPGDRKVCINGRDTSPVCTVVGTNPVYLITHEAPIVEAEPE